MCMYLIGVLFRQTLDVKHKERKRNELFEHT